MRQRLGIAEIVMKRAEVAILDEPTSGLDPHATVELLEMIRGLKKAGVAVLISSHLLDRVQSVCDRVALFNKGKIALMGTVVELANKVLGAGHPILVEASGIDVAAALRGIEGVQQVVPDGDGAGAHRRPRLRAAAARHRLGRRLAHAIGGAGQPGLHYFRRRVMPQWPGARARPSPASARCSSRSLPITLPARA
jgi:ABC-2 type transport system ATP-binding protein